MDELHGKLEVASQEHDAAVHLSEEKEEQAQSTQGSLMGKTFHPFHPVCWFLECDPFDSPPKQMPSSRWLPSNRSSPSRWTELQAEVMMAGLTVEVAS
jgi:hypothetical protein